MKQIILCIILSISTIGVYSQAVEQWISNNTENYIFQTNTKGTKIRIQKLSYVKDSISICSLFLSPSGVVDMESVTINRIPNKELHTITLPAGYRLKGRGEENEVSNLIKAFSMSYKEAKRNIPLLIIKLEPY